MNKLLVALAALPTLATAAPAADRYRDRTDAAIDHRISQLQTQLRTGIRDGDIDRREAVPLRTQLRELILVERRFRRDGFSSREATALERRMHRLAEQVRRADG